MAGKDEVAPWIICQEILVKAKNELILEAIDALHREVAANRMAISGDIVRIEGKDNDVDKELFVIGNMLQQEPQIREQYGKYITDAESGKITDPDVVARVEELRKFLLALTEIHVLMNFVRVFDEWMVDFSGTMEIIAIPEIIAKTAKRNASRIDALEFVLQDKAFKRNEALTEKEYEAIRTAFRMCRQ